MNFIEATRAAHDGKRVALPSWTGMWVRSSGAAEGGPYLVVEDAHLWIRFCPLIAEALDDRWEVVS